MKPWTLLGEHPSTVEEIKKLKFRDQQRKERGRGWGDVDQFLLSLMSVLSSTNLHEFMFDFYHFQMIASCLICSAV